jgi:hypothetical protein
VVFDLRDETGAGRGKKAAIMALDAGEFRISGNFY